MTLPKIDIDMILSDPMLLIGVGLVAFGLLLFLISFWKLIFSRRSAKKFVMPKEEPHEEIFNAPPPPEPEPELEPEPAPFPQAPQMEEPVLTPPPVPVENGDKTVVMQASETETQIQLDIIVSQLKNLNRKVSEMEEKLENVPEITNTTEEIAALKELPVNAEDFAKKLLKLAEHVIFLEKEVARLKQASPAATAAKPPIMPL